MIRRSYHIELRAFEPDAEGPDEIGDLGDVELSVDGEPVDPINVVRCEHGILHLVYSTTPQKPSWAHDPDVEDQILGFVDEVLEKWREEQSQ